jgi:hypothetical protein
MFIYTYIIENKNKQTKQNKQYIHISNTQIGILVPIEPQRRTYGTYPCERTLSVPLVTFWLQQNT